MTNMYEVLFDSFPTAIAVAELEFKDGVACDFTIFECNPAFKIICKGITADCSSLKGSDFFKISPPPHLDGIVKVLDSGATYEYSAKVEQIFKNLKIIVIPLGKNKFALNVSDNSEFVQAKQELERKIFTLTKPLEAGSGNISFNDIFDLDDMQALQDQFADATGVASIITTPDGVPITKPSNFSRLCNDLIRKTPKGCKNCYKSDAEIGKLCKDGPIVRPCMSGGLWDAGAGISVGGRHIANWLIGQVRDETQSEEKIRAYARMIDLDEDEAAKAFNEVTPMSSERFSKIADVVFTIAKQMSRYAYQNVQQARLYRDKERSIKEKMISEYHYEEIFNASHDAIFIQHATTGKIIDVNDRMLEMYGYLKNEVINFDVDLFSSDDPRFSHKVAKEKFLAAVNVGPQSFEWQAKRKNGELFPVEVHLSHSQIGNYPRLLAIVRDITERKKTTAD